MFLYGKNMKPPADYFLKENVERVGVITGNEWRESG
jgi:hypothetical protein